MTIINQKYAELTADGEIKTLPQDITTSTIILPFAQVVGKTTIAADTVVDAYTINVTSVAGIVVGQHLRLIDEDKFYFGTILSIADPIVTLDTPIDNIYEIGAEVTFSDIDMAVNGSVTPVSFLTRTGTISIAARVDVTRILFTCITDTPITLPEFGDLPVLTNGLTMRINKNGTRDNILNVKSNQEIINIAYDFDIFLSSNPAQGIDGFSSRLTFAGHDKVGSALRIQSDENVEFLVQDDLTGLTSLKIFFEGHITPD